MSCKYVSIRGREPNMIGMRGRGPGRGFAEPPPVETAEVAGWFAGRLPDSWFTAPPEITSTARRSRSSAPCPRRRSPAPRRVPGPRQPGPQRRPVASAVSARKPATDESRSRARPSTATPARWPGARAWGTPRSCSPRLSAPVMTRLRQPERQVLDTLVDAGVARSRSDALAWCVRLVGRTPRTGSPGCAMPCRRWSGCGLTAPAA